MTLVAHVSAFEFTRRAPIAVTSPQAVIGILVLRGSSISTVAAARALIGELSDSISHVATHTALAASI